MVKHRIIIRDVFGQVHCDYTLNGESVAVTFDPPVTEGVWERRIIVEVSVVKETDNG